MNQRPGVLFSQMEPPHGEDAEFNEWYEEDHIPARMVLDGFTKARRFRAVIGEPQYLALYELSALNVLATDEYRELKAHPSAQTTHMLTNVEAFTRYTCVQLSDVGRPDAFGPIVWVVAFTVPDEDEQEFNDWYHFEHEPRLLECDDWLRIRRFKVIDREGGPWTHLAIHELANTEALDSPARQKARDAPLRAALASAPWFEVSGRWLYEEISSHEGMAKR